MQVIGTKLSLIEIKSTFPDASNALFKQSGAEPIMDMYGRVSFVYFQFYHKKIPIPQPGSFRIESGAFVGS